MRWSATPSTGFVSTSVLEIDPKELRVTTGNGVRVEGAVVVLGSGLTRVARIGFALLGEDDRVLHRYAEKGPDETHDRFGFVAKVIPEGFRPRDLRAIVFEDTTEQHFPMELVWEYPVIRIGDRVELGERKQRRSRGLRLLAATATASERGLDVELQFGPPGTNRVYDAVSVCVLATTDTGMELERATAPVASDRAIASITLSPAQLPQLRTLDIRLEGTIYHDGPTGRFALYPA